jgi:hypothetical protein
MADRRTPRAQKRFNERYVAVPLTQTEARQLRQIQAGMRSCAKFRQRLANKGLVTSSIFRKCQLTPKGKVSLQEHDAAKVTDMRPVDPPIVEKVKPDPREKWLAKFAPPFSRAAA